MRLTLAGWAVAAYAVLALILTTGVVDGPATPLISALAPLGALFAAIAAIRALPPAAGGPWMLMGLGAMAAIGESALGLVPGGTAVFPGKAGALALFATGLAWTLHQRDRGRQAEIALDVLLIAGAGSVAMLRWAPGLRALDKGSAGFPLAMSIDVLVAPTAAICAVAFAGVLLSALRTSKAGDSAAALAGAATLLGLGTIPLATAMPVATGPFAVAELCGWGLVAFAGLRVRGGGSELFLPADTDPGGAKLRQGVAPVVALLIAVIIVDAGTREPLAQTAAVAVGLLCVGLALRVSRLLEATKDYFAEQRQLAQSQALIEVSHALACRTTLDDTLGRVAEWACRLLDARAAVIEMLTDEGDVLEVRAAVGFPDEYLRLRFPIADSFTGWVVRNGVHRVTLDASAEPDIHLESRRYLGRSPVAAAPLRYHDRTLGVLACVSPHPFDSAGLEMLGALADQAATAIENARLFEKVHVLSKTDPLTGLANRRQLESDLQREFSAAVRGRRLVAVMFDLNDFKDYNDRYGHLAGDEALKAFGDVLRTEMRTMNFAARYGGDEFVALLADTPDHGARIFSLRVRRSFSRRAMALGRPITASAGFAEYHPDMKRPEDLLGAADEALYRSKAKRSRAG